MRTQPGFSLIELMIVMAIIGIIAAVAYPSYRQFVRDARRADAQAALTDLASAMERYYSENLTYAGAADNNNVPKVFAVKSPVDGSETYYQLRVTAADNSGYTLRANPVNAQAGDGFLRLRGTGERGWDRDNDGSIANSESCWKDKCN